MPRVSLHVVIFLLALARGAAGLEPGCCLCQACDGDTIPCRESYGLEQCVALCEHLGGCASVRYAPDSLCQFGCPRRPSATASATASATPSEPPSPTPTLPQPPTATAAHTATAKSDPPTATATLPVPSDTPTRSHTATSTPSPSPSSTPSPSLTATATGTVSPTPTPTPPPCTGDCDGLGEVTVDELVTGVSMVLGTRELALCPSFDRNADSEVSVEELVEAVRNAVRRCP